MTQEYRNKVAAEIERQVLGGKSAANIARMAGLNDAYISLMRNGKGGGTLKAEHWNKVAAALNVRFDGWNIVETQNFKIVNTVLEDARANSLFMAVSHNAGSGKSLACREFSAANASRSVHLYRVEHGETNKIDFLKSLAKSLGIDTRGQGYMSANRLADAVISFFEKRLDQAPLLIVDEADKLTDKALRFFISLYNAVEGRMGCVILGTENLEKKIRSGVAHNRNGFDEIDSRFGRRYISLTGITQKECREICAANGIQDGQMADRLFQECEPVTNDYRQKVLRDLRPLERKVRRELMKLNDN
jgi:type II secretory pathway predicted ATPase ExeA